MEWKPLPTIWDVPDDRWDRIGPVILELDPPQSKGRKRVDQRKMLEGIIFRLRSGCQALKTCAWTKGMTIPQATGQLPPFSTVRISGALGRRSWTNGERNPSPPDGGWWNAPWAGSPSAGRYWCATTRSRPITWACFNWLVPSSGTAVGDASLF